MWSMDTLGNEVFYIHIRLLTSLPLFVCLCKKNIFYKQQRHIFSFKEYKYKNSIRARETKILAARRTMLQEHIHHCVAPLLLYYEKAFHNTIANLKAVAHFLFYSFSSTLKNHKDVKEWFS